MPRTALSPRGHTLCASPRNRNASQDFTRATLYVNLREKCRAPDWSQNAGTHFVRACTIEMQVKISQEPLCTELYRKNAGAQMDYPDQAPAFTPTVRTPQCGHAVWGKKRCFLFSSKHHFQNTPAATATAKLHLWVWFCTSEVGQPVAEIKGQIAELGTWENIGISWEIWMGYTEIIGDFIGMLPGKHRMWKNLWGLTVWFEMIYIQMLAFPYRTVSLQEDNSFWEKKDGIGCLAPLLGSFHLPTPTHCRIKLLIWGMVMGLSWFTLL